MRLQQQLNRNTQLLAEHTRLFDASNAGANAAMDECKELLMTEMNALRKKTDDKFRHQGKQLEWFQRKLDTHKRELRSILSQQASDADKLSRVEHCLNALDVDIYATDMATAADQAGAAGAGADDTFATQP